MDLNGDGKPDLAVTNFDGRTVTLLLGNGMGGFVSPYSLYVGDEVRSISAGDWNGDGRLDLAVPLFNSDRVSLLVNMN